MYWAISSSVTDTTKEVNFCNQATTSEGKKRSETEIVGEESAKTAAVDTGSNCAGLIYKYLGFLFKTGTHLFIKKTLTLNLRLQFCYELKHPQTN